MRSTWSFGLVTFATISMVQVGCSDTPYEPNTIAEGGNSDTGAGSTNSDGGASPTNSGSGGNGGSGGNSDSGVSSTNSGSGGQGSFVPLAGTATATGALEGTYRCDGVGVWYVGLAKGGVNLQFTDSNMQLVGQGTFYMPARPEVGTYSEVDFVADATTVALGDSAMNVSKSWGATRVPGHSQGSYTMTLTEVVLLSSTQDTESYGVHGTFAATLEATLGTAATGTVTLNANF